MTEKPEQTEITTEPTDIFLWANQADAHKDALEIDLFLFTKGYTVYATNYAKELKAQLKVLFLYDMISQVQTGAATGMMVRDFEAAAAEDNVLERTTIDRVEHAQEVVEQILYGEESLEVFREGDHEFKKVKGIVARFSRRILNHSLSRSCCHKAKCSKVQLLGCITATHSNHLAPMPDFVSRQITKYWWRVMTYLHLARRSSSACLGMMRRSSR